MNEMKEITVEELIRKTVDLLNSISVPIRMMDSVGMPIQRSVMNLESCLEAFKKAAEEEAKKNQAESSDDEEPQISFDIEPVPEEEVPNNE